MRTIVPASVGPPQPPGVQVGVGVSVREGVAVGVRVGVGVSVAEATRRVRYDVP